MCGLRAWNNNLAYYVMATTDNCNNNNNEGNGNNNNTKQCIWSIAKYDKENSNVDTVHLVTINQNENNEEEDIENIFEIPKNIKSFKFQFSNNMKSAEDDEVYTPSNEDARVCSIVVMGPG